LSFVFSNIKILFSLAKIIRERWKYWSGSVPANVSVSLMMNFVLVLNCSCFAGKVRLHRLESLLSINEEVRQGRSIHDKQSTKEISFNMSSIPLQQMSKMDSSQPFLTEIINCSSIDKYFTERIEPKHNIIIQGVSDF
jgi:hypothetical protein